LPISLILACISALCGLLPQAVTPSGFALVEGSVVNKVTGSPVKHARVMYVQVGLSSGRNAPTAGVKDTDSAGHFSIEIAPGSYQFWAEQSGFVRQYYGSRTPDGPRAALALTAGQQLRDVTLQLMPLGAISGHVFDEDGDPLQGTSIQVMKFTFSNGRRQLAPVSGTASDDRGEYRAYGLPAGHYFLLAARREWPAYAGLFYPGVPDLASATEISLPEGGDVTGIDFSLRNLHLVTLRGRLVTPAPNFADSQLQVILARREGDAASYLGRASAVVNQATGTFEIRDVMPGSYWLVAAQLYGKYELGGRVPLEVAETSPPENVSVSLTPGFEIRGSVEMNGVGKLPGFKVGMRASENLTLGPQPTTTVDPRGDIQLAGLTPGVWDLMIDSLSNNYCVTSATLNNTDLLTQPVTLSGDPRQTLHIAVSSTCPTISGTVLDENGQPRHTIVLVVPAEAELRSSPQSYRTVPTDEQGAFVFRGVRPGSYKLFALEDVAPFAWLDPDFLAPLEPVAVSISVSDGDHAELRLTPIPPEVVPPTH
jgi:hypothetical protein